MQAQQLAQAQAQEQQRLAEIQQARQLQNDYLVRIQQAMQVTANTHAAEFPDVQNYQQLAELAQNDPQRASRYIALQEQYNKLSTEQQNVAQSQAQLADLDQQQRQQQAAVWVQQQDLAFEQMHPEWRDPAVKQKEQEQVVNYLTKERGLTIPEIMRLYNNDATFRSAAAQNMLLDAARYHHAKTRVAEVQSRHLPPVQKPGVGRDRAWIDADRLQALDSRLEKTGNVRHAADLLRARRAASR